MKHMKYLESKIDPMSKESELQLCIQCDIDTFEWLMKYIHGDQNVIYNSNEEVPAESCNSTASSSNTSFAETLELNQGNIIKLLIPAEFL